MGEPHVEGLLHLAAFAVIVTAAYVGLDKQEKFRSAFNTIAPQVASQAPKARMVIIELDLLQNEVAILETVYGLFWLYLICYVTGIKYQQLPWWNGALFFLRRQKHVPLLGYFRRRWDLTTITAMFFLSLLSFIFLVAATLDFELNVGSVFLRLIFVGYIVTIFWVLFSLFVLHWRLQKIEETCEGCYRLIRNKAREIKNLADKIKSDMGIAQ